MSTNVVVVVRYDQEEYVWITTRGQSTPVTQMTTQHIKNTINCWHGNGKTKFPRNFRGGKNKWLGILNRELERRVVEERTQRPNF